MTTTAMLRQIMTELEKLDEILRLLRTEGEDGAKLSTDPEPALTEQPKKSASKKSAKKKEHE